MILLPDGDYAVIPPTEVLDTQGGIRRNFDESAAVSFEGWRAVQPDPSNYNVGLAPEAWPVVRGSLVRFPDGREIVITAAQFRGTNDPTSPVVAVNYVHLEGRLRDASQQPTS